MPILNIPSLGRFRVPEGTTQEEQDELIRGLVAMSGVQPKGPQGIGEVFSNAVARGAKQMLVGTAYDLPALGLAGLAKLGFGGAEEKALDFLGKGAQRYAAIEQELPTQYRDVTKLEGPGQYLGFAVEQAGQGLPSIASALLPGGIAAATGRGAARKIAQEAAETALRSGVTREVAERIGEKAAQDALAGRAGLAMMSSSYLQTAPESFRNIFEETKQLEPGLALATGLANSFIESYIPGKILGDLGLYGRTKLVEKALERGGFTKEALRIGAKASGIAAQEGLTEAAQDIINSTAVKIIDENYQVFSPENINKYLNSFAAGAAAGAGPGLLGAVGDRTRPVQTPPETPPRGGVISPTPPAVEPVAPQQVGAVQQPVAQEVPQAQPQVTVPPVTPAMEMPQAVPPVQPVTASPQASLPAVTQPAAPPVAPPVTSVQAAPPVQQAAPPVTQPAPPTTVPPVQAVTAPPSVPQVVSQAPSVTPAPATTSPEVTVPPVTSMPALPAPPVTPEPGPPEFVEPPPETGPAPLPEEIAPVFEYEKELLGRREALEKGKGSLWSALKGRISYEDIKDASPDIEFRTLAGNPTNPNFKGLDLMVKDGDLDAWLPPELQSTNFDRDPTLETVAVNSIKERLADKDLLTDATKQELEIIDYELSQIIPLIREYESELERELAVTEAAEAAQRERLDAEQAALQESLAEAVPKGEAGVARPGEAAGQRPIPPVTQAVTAPPTVPQVTAPPVTAAPVLPKNAIQAERDMFTQFRDELDRIGLKDLNLEFIRPKKTKKGYTVGEMATYVLRGTDAAGNEKLEVTGRLLRVAIDLAKRTKSESAQNPERIKRTLHHEVIHALRSMNLFTADEWRILSEASAKDWVKRKWPDDHGMTVEQIYRKESKDTKLEEGVARAFEYYTRGEFQPAGAVARIFQKTKEFFKKLADYAMGLGITETEAEVFERIMSGEIGSRVRKDQTLYKQPYDKANIEAGLDHSDAFNKWFGDSKVVGPKGEPKVMYHGTYRGGFSAFDRMKTTEWRRESMDTIGSWFSDNPSVEGGAGMYASGEGASIYPVFLSIKKPKVYKTFTAFLNEMHKSAGRDPKTQTPRGVGSTKELREKLKAQGYDGIKFERTSNQQLIDEINELDDLIKAYKYKDPQYASELEQDRKRAARQYEKSGGSTEFDRQDVWVAFEPNQIKSVFNKGTWSPESEIILENRVESEEIILNAANLDVDPETSMNNLVKSGPDFNQIKNNTRDYIKDLATDKADILLSTLNLRQLGEIAANALPQIKSFYRDVNDMLAFRDTRITKAADIATPWVAFNDKNPELARALADVMHDATIAGIDPDTRLDEIKNPELLKNWEKVSANPEALKIYREVRDYYAESLDLYQKALEQRINESMEEGRPKTAALLKLEQEFNRIRETGPYFPLARFGDYWVSFDTFNDEGKKVPEYYMFESRNDQRQFIDQLNKQGIKHKSGVKTREMISQGIPMTGFVREMMDLVDGMDGDKEALKDNIWQMFLTMQPDLSARKHFIHRKKVAGYSPDALRAFAETSFHGAYHLARVRYNGRLEARVLEARQYKDKNPSVEADRYFDELLRRKQWVNAPEDVNSFNSLATSFSFLYFLTAPASALVNIAQTPMVAFPYLGGKFGYGKTFSALSRASKDFFASGIGKGRGFYDVIRTLQERVDEKGISDRERKRREEELGAMQKLYEDGTLNRTQTLSLAGLAERPSDVLQGGLGSVMRNKSFTTVQKVTYGLGYAFNQAEVFNRQITALAAYRLAKERGLTPDVALQMAKDIVNETHFEYTNATKPRFMQGPTARIIFQFKNYAQQMTYLLVRTVNEAVRDADPEVRREAQKRLGGILFMTGLFAGYEGLPMYWVIEGVMNAMFDDEDEPYDFNNSAKNTIADLFGSNAARILSKGAVSEILGGDIANRVGMNGMWFRDSNKSADEVEAFRQFVTDLAGPFVGIGVNISDGIKKINDGNTYRGIEAMLPPVLKDFMKVGRMATEGATTLRGDPIVGEVSTWGLFLQALGFTPVDIARGYEAMAEIKGMDKDLDQRRKRLLQQVTLAQINGDYTAFGEIYDKIEAFNEKNPENPISKESIKRSLAQRVKDTDRALRGIIVNPKREYLLEEARYLGEED
jgi:hypothetical protein